MCVLLLNCCSHFIKTTGAQMVEHSPVATGGKAPIGFKNIFFKDIYCHLDDDKK